MNDAKILTSTLLTLILNLSEVNGHLAAKIQMNIMKNKEE